MEQNQQHDKFERKPDQLNVQAKETNTDFGQNYDFDERDANKHDLNLQQSEENVEQVIIKPK